jgi:S-adenosylmethionine synthetase
MKKTAEFVSPKHPDKICDIVADTILAAYMKADPQSRVAVEVMGGHGHISVSGEVTSAAQVDIEAAVRGVEGVPHGMAVHIYLVPQSPEIGGGVDTGGAGDQGIMTGYATRETPERLPREYVLARTLCKTIYAKYPFDGKTQVTIDDETGAVETVVASFQNAPAAELLALVRLILPGARNYFVNPAGDWSQGGFDADSGLSGRKLIVDNYGPEVAIGGGSFSGKDWTKVDRSGAYMARRIAVDYLKKFAGENIVTVRVKLAYAIGRAEPVMAVAELEAADGSRREVAIAGESYDLTPRGIFAALKLDTIDWPATAAWGHFGREFPWG